MPPLHAIAHVGHVEVRTPVPAESLEFFTRYLGLTENGSDGDSVFLRAWDDYENVTIKLTGHTTSGIGRTTFRAATPEALEQRVKQIEAGGRGSASGAGAASGACSATSVMRGTLSGYDTTGSDFR